MVEVPQVVQAIDASGRRNGGWRATDTRVPLPAGMTEEGKPFFDPRVFDTAEFAQNPYPYYKLLRDHYPLYYDDLHNCWYITRYHDIVDCYLNEGAFNTIPKGSSSGVLGNTILELGAEEHRRRRNLFQPYLVGQGLLPRIPQIERTASIMIDRFIASAATSREARVAEDTRADRTLTIAFADAFAKTFPINVVSAVCGLPERDEGNFYYWYHTMMTGLTASPDLHEAGLEARTHLDNYLIPFIAERRVKPGHLYDLDGNDLGEDILSRLCHIRMDGKPLSDEEICSIIALLLGGGGETTRGALLNMWYLLLMHPDQMAAVERDSSLVAAAFHETLRHSTSVGGMPRHTSHDVEFYGQTMPAGSLVHLVDVSANHDERVFKDPEEFNIFRDDLYTGKLLRSGYRKNGRYSHLAFAVGAHFCPGAWISEQEAILGTQILLRRIKNVRLNREKHPELKPIGLGSITELWMDFDLKE